MPREAIVAALRAHATVAKAAEFLGVTDGAISNRARRDPTIYEEADRTFARHDNHGATRPLDRPAWYTALPASCALPDLTTRAAVQRAYNGGAEVRALVLCERVRRVEITDPPARAISDLLACGFRRVSDTPPTVWHWGEPPAASDVDAIVAVPAIVHDPKRKPRTR